MTHSATVPSYDAYVFDVDGVLVEVPSRDALREAAARTFSRFGLESPSRDGVRALVTGDVERITDLCRAAGVDRSDFCTQAAREAYRAQKRELERGLRSVYDDVNALSELSAPSALVSNNLRRVVEEVVDRFDLRTRLGVESVRAPSFTPEELSRTKPDPHYLCAACDDVGVAPERTLYVGDEPVDVAAATRAGADSAFVRREGRENAAFSTPEGLDAGEPTYVVESLHELVE
ncbi:HAD family hydrolase [Halopelagius longus]|uniref:HAD family hydrolase n=1 Tax=Halopelagius longus TaxID=1236180 RepID=A0A1H1ECS0_9EURY|nr:HAD family hydrolase [Halopelagius longus]RDI71697.1 HAD family hydrolase [Halopelagius longus]SDQ86424.1 phosphoglycolate phosphatase [Halopelagius longus]